MPTIVDILTLISEEEKCSLKQLAERLKIPEEKLEAVVKELSENDIVEYDQHSGIVKMSSWLAEVERGVEEIRPAVGTIIIPKNQEVKIQDIAIQNFTGGDLEINVRLKAKLREISIRNLT